MKASKPANVIPDVDIVINHIVTMTIRFLKLIYSAFCIERFVGWSLLISTFVQKKWIDSAIPFMRYDQ